MCIFQMKMINEFCCCIPLRTGGYLIALFECFYNFGLLGKNAWYGIYGSTGLIQVAISVLYGILALLYLYALCWTKVGLMELYVCAYCFYIPSMLFLDVTTGFLFEKYVDFTGELLYKSGVDKSVYPLIVVTVYSIRFYCFLCINSLTIEIKEVDQ